MYFTMFSSSPAPARCLSPITSRPPARSGHAAGNQLPTGVCGSTLRARSDEGVVGVDGVGDVGEGIGLRAVLVRHRHLQVDLAADGGEDETVLYLLGEPADAVDLEALGLCLGHPGRRRDAAGDL